MTPREALSFARLVARESKRRDVPTYAASIAYYAFVSLVPLLALTVAAAAWLGGPDFEALIVRLAQRYLLPTSQELVGGAFRNTAGRRGTTIVGLGVLLWSGLRLFRGLDVVFSRVYGSTPGGLTTQLLDAAFVLASIAIAAIALGATAALVGAVAPTHPLAGVLASGFVLLTLATALFPVYYVFPDKDVTVREAIPGTVFAAIGWTVAGAAFGAYATYALTAGGIAMYGLLGGLILLVTWFYVAGMVLLVGVVLNAALAGRLYAAGVTE